MNNIRTQLQECVKTALAEKTPLRICAGNSKACYGNTVQTDHDIDIKPYNGIIHYEPTELCVTVRAGTRLSDLEAELSKHQQILPFEPPHLTPNATIGGTIATGLSGPRRPYSGAVRDAILGVTIIDGQGEIVRFGGQVMKNVAGYDVSRLMTGAQGTLGVLLDISLRLIPKPEHNITYQLQHSQQEALDYFTHTRRSGLPITASCHHQQQTYIRLSGTKKHLAELVKTYDIQTMEENDNFWCSIRDQKHIFFQRNEKPLWRILCSPAAPLTQQVDVRTMLEWNGAVRWMASNMPANIIQNIAQKADGEAVLFRGRVAGISTFKKPDPALFQLYQRLKRQLDPKGIFNPNRLYEGL